MLFRASRRQQIFIGGIDLWNYRVMEGEWHFSWVLEGMAIQDVMVKEDGGWHVKFDLYAQRA